MALELLGTATNFMCPTGCEAGLKSGSAHKLAAVEQIALRLVEIENLHALLCC